MQELHLFDGFWHNSVCTVCLVISSHSVLYELFKDDFDDNARKNSTPAHLLREIFSNFDSTRIYY